MKKYVLPQSKGSDSRLTPSRKPTDHCRTLWPSPRLCNTHRARHHELGMQENVLISCTMTHEQARHVRLPAHLALRPVPPVANKSHAGPGPPAGASDAQGTGTNPSTLLTTTSLGSLQIQTAQKHFLNQKRNLLFLFHVTVFLPILFFLFNQKLGQLRENQTALENGNFASSWGGRGQIIC